VSSAIRFCLAISSALSQRAGVRVLIQLGAILAILAVYARRILDLALGLATSARHFPLATASLSCPPPAAVIGVFAHGFSKVVQLGGLASFAAGAWSCAISSA
jgi:undecaprenyl pyrophosphate phosphatase UppP